MAVRELYYGQSGSIIFDDTELATDWYPAPYDVKPLRGALFSQAYVTDVPVDDIEIVRLVDMVGHWSNLFLLMGG